MSARAALLERLAKDITALEKSLRSAKTTAASRAAIRRLSAKIASTKAALSALPRSALGVYLDDALTQGLDNLSAALTAMDLGIGSDNRDKVIISLLALKRTLQSDWGKALVTPDTTGSAIYDRQVEQVRTLADQAQQARADASQTRSLLTFVGALALLGAALTGLYWLQR